MARDAGIKAAEYVIQQWPELFPSRDFSPVCHEVVAKICRLFTLQDIRPRTHSEVESSEAALQCM